jgi:hypothetical protein
MKKKSLHKTTITIWTDGDVFKGYPDLATLAREAETGDAYCTKQECVKIEDIETSKDEEVLENYEGLSDFFFGEGGADDEWYETD